MIIFILCYIATCAWVVAGERRTFLEKRKIIEKIEVLEKGEGANHFISSIYCVHIFKGIVTCIFPCFPS